MLRIDSQDPRPIYCQIMDGLLREIVAGKLEPDAAVPSVRDLARHIKVNPNTVRQAYRELELAGVLYVKRGLGTFVVKREFESDRRKLALELAQRALREARQLGLRPDLLIEAIQEAREREADDEQEVGESRA